MTTGAVSLAAHDHTMFADFGWIEWTLTIAAALFVAWSIWRAVRYTMYPGEESPDHVKRLILDDEPPPQGGAGPDPGLSSRGGEAPPEVRT